jgi:hypothetical protein
MTQIHFTDEMQKEIYDQVFGKNRKWLKEAVAYVHRVRRGYPEDDPRWNDKTTVDHVLYYVTVAKGMKLDATLDDRNVMVKVRRWLDNNPCIMPEAPKAFVPAPDHGLDIEAEMNRAMSAHIVSETDAKIISEQLDATPAPPEPPAPTSEPPVTTPEVTKKVVKKKATKKKASKKKATKKKTSKKKTTKKKVSKKT